MEEEDCKKIKKRRKIRNTPTTFPALLSRESGEARTAAVQQKNSMLPATLSRPCGGGGAFALRQQATTVMVASTSMPASSSSSFVAPRRRRSRSLSLLPLLPRAIGKGASSFGEEEEPSKESIEMRK